MKPSRARPQLEALSDRVLPSASPVAPPSPAFAAVQSPALPALTGHADGSYTTRIVGVDSGAAYTFQGTAALNGQGVGRVTGTIQTVGLLVQGHANGTLTFTHGQDHITLQVTGPTQRFFAPLPTTFSYKVLEATGAYRSFRSQQGWLTLNLSTPTSNSTPSPGPGRGAHGTFTMSFATLPFTLGGQGHGTYTAKAMMPDAGSTYTFQGSASLTGLGNAVLSGTIGSVGMILNGHAGGTLTFTLGNEHVTLQVTGPAQRAFAALPTTFSYKVIEATGPYRPLLGYQGSLRLVLAAPVPIPGIEIGRGSQGSFWLVIDSLRLGA
jgi:hypothetical protein